MLSTDKTEQLKRQLLSTKAELLALATSYQQSSETVVLDQCAVGRLSRLDAMQAQQMSLQTDQRRKIQLIRIEGALRRIESGDFGVCYLCGEEIEAARLSADPTITRCMACANK